MNKLSTTLGLLTLVALPAARAAALPSVTTMGVAVKDQTNIAKPADFAQKVAGATKLDQARHGCNWASLPEIYAFADALVYTKPGSNNFNVFTADTANSRGCALPSEVQRDLSSDLAAVSYENQADMSASYSLVSITDVKKVKSGNKTVSYYNIGDRQKAAPATFVSDIKTGLQITQAQHGCKDWATRPFIFVFSDAVAYVNSQATDVNVFSIDEVKAKGCNVPSVRAGDRRNISFTSMTDVPPEMAAETGLDDVNQKMDGTTGDESMSVSTPTALKDNLNRGFCAGRWTYFDKWTVFDVDYSKFTIEVTDAILTGAFKQAVDRSAVRTIRFPVTYSKYYAAGDSGARGSATRFAHVTASGICNSDAKLQTITTKGLDVFKETLPLGSDHLVDSNDRSVHAFKEAVTIPGAEVCSNHVQSAGKRVCNRVTVTDTCEVRYYDVVREQVVITKTYTKNIDVKDSKARTITALRSTVPGITKTQIKDPSNTVLDSSGQSIQGEIFNMTCNTGDDKPVETMVDIQARYNFLEYNIKQAELGAPMTPGCESINSPDCSLTQDSDFVGFMKNFWGLHQEYNDMLTPEQRNAIRDRHILFPKYIFPGDEEIIVVDVE
jgi:hypothetical protein